MLEVKTRTNYKTATATARAFKRKKKKLIKTVNRRKRKACSKDKRSNCEALTFSTKTKIQSARAKFGAKKNSSYVDY